MAIEFGFNFLDGNINSTSNVGQKDSDIILEPDEIEAFKIVKDALSDNQVDLETIHIERRSQQYFGIFTQEGIDFCRIKIGPKSKWFTLAFLPKDYDMVANDPRLKQTADKHKFHWKIFIDTPKDLIKYSDLIFKSYLSYSKREPIDKIF